MSHKTIRRVGPLRLSLFCAVVAFFVGLICTIPFLAFSVLGEPRLIDAAGTVGTSHAATTPQMAWWPAGIVIPLVYSIATGALVAFATIIYNFLAARFGGVRIEIDD